MTLSALPADGTQPSDVRGDAPASHRPEDSSIERPVDLDELTLAGVLGGHLRDRPVTVLGFARSGIALARFLADVGARVTVYDARPASELGPAIEALGGREVRLLLGSDIDPSDTLAGAALIATSPSINPDYPTTEPRLRAALRELVDERAAGNRDDPALVSEADLFLRLCPSPTIGVTGTKGKTTTASLTAAVLAGDPVHPVLLGGNIGRPLIERLTELTPEHRVVIELSELQLPTLSRGTTVAVYTNVTSDHLDRHGSLEAYRRVKRRLGELVPKDGAVVLNADDPVVSGYAFDAPAVRYRLERPAAGEVGVLDGWIVADSVRGLDAPALSAVSARILPTNALRIPGRHNVSNAMAAVATGLLFGVDPAAIREAVTAFSGVEHRLEIVATIDRVRFVNDSQGTQPDAVIAALRAFEPPIVLIAGGRGKGVDLGERPEVAVERAAAVVLIGETGAELGQRFGAAGLGRSASAGSMEEAVSIATEMAREALVTDGGPATVLLSPAATSFDMFTDYEARGRAFKDAVARLATEVESNEEGSR
jgi:UDP-N-acetylmuramoylalanine--D-glutamate ligase